MLVLEMRTKIKALVIIFTKRGTFMGKGKQNQRSSVINTLCPLLLLSIAFFEGVTSFFNLKKGGISQMELIVFSILQYLPCF